MGIVNKIIVGVVAVVALTSNVVNADCYMHNPRGSNCRLNEANVNRNNGNRLFDTQNNAKGGYCWGPAMSYYEGSQLTVEWTNQHGCGNPKLECNLVIQYMCGYTPESENADDIIQIRDGTVTDTIPNDISEYNNKNSDGEHIYGMHESFFYYRECAARNRNGGLWLADRELENNVGSRATSTRQNNNGNRRGFECAEERDYYPYWHPTPWKDIAILTNSIDQCSYYQSESQNVKAKNRCAPNGDGTGGGIPDYVEYNNEAECSQNGHEWETVESWGLDAPECILAPRNRQNHLGNGLNGYHNSYNWTLPTAQQEPCIASDECVCVLRLRYNISTGDFNGWGLRDGKPADYTQNKENSPIRNDPYVPLIGSDGTANLSLAIDTTQFGRTFQDRSHTFHISPRPSHISPVARIYNLNVRGKRGNIVQTYPAVEYDFVPQQLHARVGDYIHFQWTGCDNNPAGNAGEGKDGTDRTGITQLPYLDGSLPVTEEWLANPANTPLFDDLATAKEMAYLGQESCKTLEELLATNDNNNDVEQDDQNCMKLNAASPYFNGGVLMMNKTGNFVYMGHRNNNFSNRGQKGSIIISTIIEMWAIVLIVIGSVLFTGAGIISAGYYKAYNQPQSMVGQFFNQFT